MTRCAADILPAVLPTSDGYLPYWMLFVSCVSPASAISHTLTRRVQLARSVQFGAELCHDELDQEDLQQESRVG